jgi:hypothetical protein
MNAKREYQYNTEGKHAQRYLAADEDESSTNSMGSKRNAKVKRHAWPQGTDEYQQMIAENIVLAHRV